MMLCMNYNLQPAHQKYYAVYITCYKQLILWVVLLTLRIIHIIIYAHQRLHIRILKIMQFDKIQVSSKKRRTLDVKMIMARISYCVRQLWFSFFKKRFQHMLPMRAVCHSNIRVAFLSQIISYIYSVLLSNAIEILILILYPFS